MTAGDVAFTIGLFIGAPLGLILCTMYWDMRSPRHLRAWWFK
jgi:hypothetical protein